MLNIPLPFPSRRSILMETLFLTGYVLFVLMLFQPFGTYEYAHPYKLMQLGGYALLVALAYPLIKKSLLLFRRSTYFLKDELLLLTGSFAAIILLAFLYHAAVIAQDLDWRHLPSFYFYGTVVLLLPLLGLMYRARTQSQKISNTKTSVVTDKLEIKGTNQYENFYFNVADVLYLKSSGNYVMIYFQKNGELKHEIIRNTLSQVTEQLSGDFISIHRSFVANIKQFDKLLREDGKHHLVHHKWDIRLPVSKSNVTAIEQKLKDHSSFSSQNA